MRRQIDNSILEMALVGYNAKLDEVIQKMADIERQLGVRGKGTTAAAAPASAVASAKPRRKLSAAGKKAIREALKKRWAAFHAQGGKAAARPAKRTMSPAAKARLAANLAKARAAKASKRATQGA
uniref:Uncharacterized protein n=1 Tax=Solibacter usitatus (strain Ellin6076) TaxID=234267 RepID=Q02AS4_SOLUE